MRYRFYVLIEPKLGQSEAEAVEAIEGVLTDLKDYKVEISIFKALADFNPK